MRAIFLLGMIGFNIKMVECKIKSFAKVGASLTVILAFFTGYIFNVFYEMFLFDNYPGVWQYAGSWIIFMGIAFIQQDEKINNERRLKEKTLKDKEKALLLDMEKAMEKNDTLIEERQIEAIIEEPENENDGYDRKRMVVDYNDEITIKTQKKQEPLPFDKFKQQPKNNILKVNDLKRKVSNLSNKDKSPIPIRKISSYSIIKSRVSIDHSKSEKCMMKFLHLGGWKFQSIKTMDLSVNNKKKDIKDEDVASIDEKIKIVFKEKGSNPNNDMSIDLRNFRNEGMDDQDNRIRKSTI